MNKISLEDIGLFYYDIGINKKIHTLINENVKCYISYEKIEVEKNYQNNSYSRMKSDYAGYSNTYMKKIPIKWEYNINSLIKFFKSNNKIIYRRKEVEFNNLTYIKQLEEIKNKL